MKRFKPYLEDVSTSAASVGVGSVGIGFDPKLGKKGKQFDVSTDVFRRFSTGRNKFERWNKFLDLNDENQKAIYDYATKNRGASVILRDSETGAIRAIRPKSSNLL